MAAFSWWSVGFWAALTLKDAALFLASLKLFAALTLAAAGTNVLKTYCVDMLNIRWRNWLTKTMIERYISGKTNFLDLTRHATQIDNPAQRIQEDVQSFVETTTSLLLNFLNAALTLITFIGTLWVIGGSLSFVVLGSSIVIPGYLVWCALLLAIISSALTHAIGHKLTKLTHEQRDLEADFRKDMELLNHESESIAQEHGERYYKRSLLNTLKNICKNAYQRLLIRVNLTAYNSFYQQASVVLPYIIAAPLYFTTQLAFASLWQITFAFSQVQISLNFFIDSYETLATYKTTIERLVELERALSADGLTSSPKNIHVHQNEYEHNIEIKNLNVTTPSSTNFIMRNLNISFKKGENTLIKGHSGLGKSTLFKAIANAWRYGDGQINLPHYRDVFFLPQKPSLPHDTLRAVLAYPDTKDTYTTAQYISALQAVGHMDAFIDALDTKTSWSKRLSPGQQQRISFARALLKKPNWLFLDEATASLDVASEQHLYALIKNELKATTFVSIAHRPTVATFHDRIVTVEPDQDGIMRVNEHTHPDIAVNDHPFNDTTALLKL
jgi:putative ATP-binding cassette transporter